MKATLVALLLSLGGQVPGDVAVGDGIRQATTVAPAAIIGAWRGRWTADGSPGGVIDVDFAAGPRPRTMLGYFTFVVDGTRRSARRLGNVDDSAAHFPMLGGGSIVVGLDRDGRLVGRFDQHVSAGTPAWHGLLDLARLRR